MLKLVQGTELNWGELKFIENPITAKNIVHSNHARKSGEPIYNAKAFNLPTNVSSRLDPYSEINQKLENGSAFLVNTGTNNPLLSNIKVKDQTTQCEVAHGQTDMMRNAIVTMLNSVPVPDTRAVLRQDAGQAKNDKPVNEKKEREKHVILLELEGQNDRPLPLKHNITLYVENITQGTTAARQLKEVIYNPFSNVFSTEKGDKLKVYAIPDSLPEVKKDLNDNKNLANSESNGLIAALDETGQETRSDGAILHHFKYLVPNNYIEIELIDEDGEPVSDVPFEIINNKGKVLAKGKLDQTGKSYLDGIDVSEAEIIFPKLEQKAIDSSQNGGGA